MQLASVIIEGVQCLFPNAHVQQRESYMYTRIFSVSLQYLCFGNFQHLLNFGLPHRSSLAPSLAAIEDLEGRREGDKEAENSITSDATLSTHTPAVEEVCIRGTPSILTLMRQEKLSVLVRCPD